MSEEKKPSLEETFAEIETIIEKLESGELDLDESFAFYETGMKKIETLQRGDRPGRKEDALPE